jgi:hypothetical protein
MIMPTPERGDGREVVAGRAPWMHAAGIEHGADDACRLQQPPVADAVVPDVAAIGAGEPDEAGGTTGRDVGREVVDGDARAVALCESGDTDDGVVLHPSGLLRGRRHHLRAG